MAEYVGIWNPLVIAAAHESVLSLIDASETPGKVCIFDADDVLLATIPLSTPAGVVSQSTGVLSITEVAPVFPAVAGTASYASLLDGDDVELITLPCASGTASVAGYCVLSMLSLSTATAVSLVSMTIG